MSRIIEKICTGVGFAARILLRAGVYMLTALIFREPMTRFDARLSAQRAFSFGEMRELAIRAGWENFGHKKFRFARQAIWLE